MFVPIKDLVCIGGMGILVLFKYFKTSRTMFSNLKQLHTSGKHGAALLLIWSRSDIPSPFSFGLVSTA